MLQYSPKIVTDSLVMCLDASNNKSYPTDLPVKNELVMWLDAADDTTFSYSSGTVVSQWRDKSGLNNHVSQATVANQPSRSTTKNSRKTLVFDGGDTLFNSGNVFPSNTTNYTKIAVVYQTSTATVGNVIGSRSTTSGSNYGHTIYFGGLNFRMWHDTDIVTSSISLSLNTLGIISATYVNSSGLGSVFLNGTASGTGTAANRNIVRDIEIGGLYGGNNFTGEICEALVFSRVLSAIELKQVHTYLGQKWGISNTDRSLVDLVGNNTLLFGTGNVLYMPYFDFYNKGALKFDGSNDFAGVASTTTYGTNTTWEAWVNRSVSANDYNMFMGAYLPYFGLKADGTVIFSNTINSVQQTLYSTGFTSSNDTWYYLSFTTDYNGTNTTARIYINGVLNNSATFTGAQTASNEYFGIGDGRGSSSWYPFNGKVSNVKVYNRTLSATEISQNYEAQKSKFANTIVQQGLVLNLDAGNPYSYAGAGTTWFDTSGNNYNGTLTSSPVYSTDSGGAFTFAGNYSLSPASTVNSLNGDALTVEAWIKHDSFGVAGTGRGYVSNWHSFNTLNQRGFILRTYDTQTNPSFWWCWGGGNNYDAFGPSSYVMQTGRIYHIVATYEKNVAVKIYINGNLEGTGTNSVGNTIAFDTTNGVYVGFSNINNSYMYGNIYSTRLYNRVLNAAQVLQNYNATKGRFGL